MNNTPLTKLHITKAEINALPMRSYDGPVHLICEPEAAEQAAKKLLKESLLGFDTETRPSFRSGESYLPSLLQLASATDVYLFQLKKCGLTPGLLRLLADKHILKTGVAIQRDADELRQLADFKPAGFFELADVAKKVKIKNLGLRGMAALLLGFRISKREQVSNWARNQLTDAQIRYAATDAWLGRELYLHLAGLGLIIPPPPRTRRARLTAWLKRLFGQRNQPASA